MRYLQNFIQKDLEDKFVLLAGPRQVGKTHLAQEIQQQRGGSYLNWDASEDRVHNKRGTIWRGTIWEKGVLDFIMYGIVIEERQIF